MRTLKRVLLRAVGLLFALLLLYNLWIFVHVLWYVDHNPGMTAFMERGLERLREKNPHAKLQQQWVPYNRISLNLKAAVVTSEDARFMSNYGFDWDGILNAAAKDLKEDRLVAGGSTISQQLAKNLFLSSDRNFLRKGEEAIITVMLEAVLGKRRILEIYLNVIQWGRGVYGAEAAARHYFHTSAARLSVSQSAALAAMIPDPEWYENHRYGRGYRRRVANVLDYVHDTAVPR
ncbi:MAG: monofunctional biosynthetic peptidoglycan transglycosylase [Gammaproteobacteria bacterium]|nr:monofunctional biosynthetic peptidoglycan transglycosylase [Gammaproteobacteria bacterium]